MIPKVIHYCWFGGKELPEEVKKCINTWQEIMPEYKIIRWDESNYDINKCQFIKEAYANKKWAFVSDYARLDILYNYGGIYLDTDVQVIKKFDDLLTLKGFCGFESGQKNELEQVNVGMALGMVKGLEIGRILRDEYHNIRFDLESLENITCPVLQTNTLKKYGLVQNNTKQTIEELCIFPTDYFCPMNQYTGKTIITNNTYSIHMYSATWFDDVDRERRMLRVKYSKYGPFLSNVISTFISYKREYGLIKMWGKIVKKLKK